MYVQVAICCGNGRCSSRMQRWLETYAIREMAELRITVCHGAELFREYMRSGKMWDLVFLDTELPDGNGIELGREIRQYSGDSVNIIFISEAVSRCREMFDMEPLNWHCQPLREEDIIQDIDKVMGRCCGGMQILRYAKNGVYKVLPLKDVLYIEALGKNIHFYTKRGGTVTLRYCLNRLEEMYDSYRFCRCHRSFLVNMNYVEKCLPHSFILRGGGEVPIGAKYIDRVREVVAHWEKRMQELRDCS